MAVLACRALEHVGQWSRPPEMAGCARLRNLKSVSRATAAALQKLQADSPRARNGRLKKYGQLREAFALTVWGHSTASPHEAMD